MPAASTAPHFAATGTSLSSGVKARRLAVQNVKSSLDSSDTDTPIGGMQVANGVLYIRTA